MTDPAVRDELLGLRRLAVRARGRLPVALRSGGAAAVIAVLAMLVWPETYRSRAVILPPQSEGSGSLVATLLAQSGVPAVSLLGSGQLTSDLYVEILRSRSVADRVIDALGLVREYGLERLPEDRARESVYRRLQSEASARASLSGIVTLEINTKTGPFPLLQRRERERSRQRAAALANAYCDALNRSNLDRTHEGARLTRTYLEEQTREAQDELRTWGARLLEFQRKHGAIALEEQTRLAVEVGGDLRSRLLAARLQLGLLLRTDSESSPRVRALRTQIEELERQVREIGGAATEGTARSGGNDPLFGPRFSELPDVAAEYATLYTEVKMREALVEVLTQRLYEARLQESKDLPSIQVLDRAVPPNGKAAPRRTMTVLLAGVLGALAGLVGVVLFEEFARWSQAPSE